eukprot:13715602-Alexandrium_andersonii.AAC.1
MQRFNRSSGSFSHSLSGGLPPPGHPQKTPPAPCAGGASLFFGGRGPGARLPPEEGAQESA